MSVAKTYMCDGLTDKVIQAVLELSNKYETLVEDNKRKQKLIDKLTEELAKRGDSNVVDA